jgi:lipid-binding SYLF domain-containing protein
MLKSIVILFLAGGLTGCTSLSVDQRNELDALAEVNIREMKKVYPAVEAKLADSRGYVAIDAHHAKIPFIGWGSGKGVVVDNTTGDRTYVRISRLDVGGGGGIREFDLLIILNDEKLLQFAKTGKRKISLGAEASAGTSSIEGFSSQFQSDKKYELFSRSERGASATWTLHYIRIKPYRQ